MNHWFLVGRDVMWVIVAFFPIFLTVLSRSSKAIGSDAEAELLLLATTFQAILLCLLYFGAIK